MIILKSKYEELEAKHLQTLEELDTVKAQLAKMQDESVALKEMEASVKTSLEAVEALTKENENLKAQLNTEKEVTEKQSAELSKLPEKISEAAVELVSSQGIPEPVTEEKAETSRANELVEQLNSIQDLSERRKFYEQHYAEFRSLIKQ